MDLVGQITSITAQVLRRLADGVDSTPTEPAEPREIHVHVHVHSDGPDVKPEFPKDRHERVRWGKR